MVQPYFHMGFAYVFSIGLFGPYRFDTYFKLSSSFLDCLVVQPCFYIGFAYVFSIGLFGPIGLIYISTLPFSDNFRPSPGRPLSGN